MSTVTNVSAGKPAIGGAISSAPLGTTLPEDATSTLAAAFKGLGYCSEDGLVNSNSPASELVKAWGGDNVLNLQTDRPDTFKFKLLEVINIDVLKFAYGADNVDGALSTGISVAVNSKELPDQALVVDMILRNGVLKRIVLPVARVTEIADITYADNSAIGYEVTVQAFPDEDGNTHYEYIQTPSSPTPGPNEDEEEEDSTP